MDFKEVYNCFSGLQGQYNKIVNNVSIIKANADYRAEAKEKKINDLLKELYSIYLNMIEKAKSKCDFLERDKKEGYKITKIPKLNDTERLYSLNMYQGIIDKMDMPGLLNFMQQQDNYTNTVYAECFKLSADKYRANCQPLSGEQQKIDEILSIINMEHIEGLKEINEMRVALNNMYSMLTEWHLICLYAENGDFNTTENISVIFNLQGRGLTSWTGNKSGEEVANEFNFNFKPLVR